MIGFSQKVGSPASALAWMRSACAEDAAAITTASTVASRSSAVATVSAPASAATCSARSASTSVSTTESTSAIDRSVAAWVWPMRPTPITPMRIPVPPIRG